MIRSINIKYEFIFCCYKYLDKSNIGKKCLISSLMNMSSEALICYLELANVYKSNSSKKKTDLVEMIVYGHMNGKISKSEVKDISIDTAKKILSDNNIDIRSLPGYGNSGLKKKDIIANVNKNKTSINIQKE